MEIRRGSYRTVFVLKKIVVKIPKQIYPWLKMFFKWLPRMIIAGRLKRHIRYCFESVFENWSEFVFYRKNKSYKLLVPTYFSAFGLINIQRYCEPLKMSHHDVWCQLLEKCGDVVWKDSHAFSNIDNFGVHEGKIQMVDYGSEETQEVLAICAEKIFSDFDFSFSWEERKRQLQTQKESAKS